MKADYGVGSPGRGKATGDGGVWGTGVLFLDLGAGEIYGNTSSYTLILSVRCSLYGMP